jgi:hypothetical protein
LPATKGGGMSNQEVVSTRQCYAANVWQYVAAFLRSTYR